MLVEVRLKRAKVLTHLFAQIARCGDVAVSNFCDVFEWSAKLLQNAVFGHFVTGALIGGCSALRCKFMVLSNSFIDRFSLLKSPLCIADSTDCMDCTRRRSS